MVAPSYDAVIIGTTGFVAVAILVSGLDDFFIDGVFYASRLYRRMFRARYPEITEADLRSREEQRIGVMIPAWHEDAVIAKMLRNTLSTMEYSNYEVFVGTYPNDEATNLAVEEVAQVEPRVHRVVCPHDGPTCKADCLNWIIAGIRLRDKTAAKRTEIFVLHDSEDLVHPLSFKLMNYFIPKVAMVQLPVIPLETPLREMTAGTYLDEFSESHIKDMVVRERLSGMVPSAGVGTAFSRDAVEKLSREHNNQIFNVGTFTEDYDLAFRLHAIGEKSILLQFYVGGTLVGTREYFPARFKDAVRQKARWTLGIVFHGWQQRGWEGGPALRYMIWRDRKTLMTNTVNMVGYLLLLEAALNAHFNYRGAHGAYVEIPSDSWIWKVIIADTVLLANRCTQRVWTTKLNSNWAQAALSLPRIVWGNIINFCAVAKATALFVRTSLLGKKLVWAKTAHAFPSEDQLLGFKRKFGDLMLENRLVSRSQLDKALAAQKETGKRLGDVFVDLGYVPEREVVRVLGLQLKVETRHIDPAQVPPDAGELVPEYACREHLMLVIDTQERPVVVAAADVNDARMRRWLDANLPYPYRLVLAGRRNLVEAIPRSDGARMSSFYSEEAGAPLPGELQQ